MKKNAMMLALFAMAAVAVQAENTAQKNPVVTIAPQAVDTASVKLSSDEQAFAAKLNDQNRHSFCEKFSEEQRQAVMIAANNGASADESVAHMVAALGLKDGSVANAEDESSAATK